LPTEENKLPFSASAFSKEREVYRFHFLFAGNNGSCRFPLILFSVCSNMETWTWRHGDRNMEIWKYTLMETRNMEK
jgi:hypothetical protein